MKISISFNFKKTIFKREKKIALKEDRVDVNIV